MGKSFSVHTSDGETLHGEQWLAAHPKGTLVHVHGMSEYSARYGRHWEWFQTHDWSVIGYDHRGHGQSGGPRSHFPSWNRVLDDLVEVLHHERVSIQAPLFLFGHSMGGTIAATAYLYGKLHGFPLKGVALSSPALGPGKSVPKFKLWMAHLLGSYFPKMVVPRDFDKGVLSSIEEEERKYNNDPLVNTVTSPHLVSLMFQNGSRVIHEAFRWKCPLFLCYGEKDVLISPQAIQEFKAVVPAQYLTLLVEKEGRHELWFDVFAENAREKLHKWMNVVSASKESSP